MADRVARVVIAAPHSGSGKTTLTAGLIAALSRRGLRVQPFKVGPDYIDPTYHTLAAGRTCRNLDSWILHDDRWLELFDRATRGADCAVIEGVMGLYDGARYDAETGSTAEIAKRLDAPVVIVIDAAKMARSAGAMALGLMMFDRELQIAGFIANRVGSESHGRGVAAAIEAATGKRCFGWIPREAALSIPERHLGLIPTGESGEWR
ncbi:MAG: cobyrinate a,c-diamide synthase, partial [Chloroflexi bacterium]|nr:cobyrinate a,c-diamide synthase [Chloroflexota bacterium]